MSYSSSMTPPVRPKPGRFGKKGLTPNTTSSASSSSTGGINGAMTYRNQPKSESEGDSGPHADQAENTRRHLPHDGAQARTASAHQRAAQYTGNYGSLLKLLLVNMALTIVTLGIYRFWAKTNLRRYLWGNARLLGDRVSYTGTGGELFLGFLYAMGVLFAFGLVFTLLDMLVAGSTAGLIVSNLLYLTGLAALIHFAIYRATRYRLTRTLWRGIRFGLDGSAKDYVKRGMTWTLFGILSLGFVYPWAQTALLKYRVENTRLGRVYFGLAAKPKELIGWWLGQYACIAAGIGALFLSVTQSAENPESGFGAMIFVAGAFGLGFMITNLGYRVNAVNVYMRGLSIGEVRLYSALPIWGTIGRAFTCQMVIVVIIGAVLAATGLFNGFSEAQSEEEFFTITALVGFAVIFPAIIFSGIVKNLIMLPYIAHHLCENLAIEHPDIVNEIVQGELTHLQHGEGLMDGLDADGFDAIG